jgi:hypothetical protein
MARTPSAWRRSPYWKGERWVSLTAAQEANHGRPREPSEYVNAETRGLRGRWRTRLTSVELPIKSGHGFRKVLRALPIDGDWSSLPSQGLVL